MASVFAGAAVKAVPIPSHAGLTRLSLAPKGVTGVTASDTCDASMGAVIYGNLARIHVSHGITASRRQTTLQPRFCVLRNVPMFLYYRDAKESASAPDGALLASAYTLKRSPAAAGLAATLDTSATSFDASDAVRLVLEPICAGDDAFELYAPNETDASAWIAAFSTLSSAAYTIPVASSTTPAASDGGTGSAHNDGGRALRRGIEDDLKRAEAAAEMAEVQKVKVARAYTRDLAAVKACTASIGAAVAALKSAANAVSSGSGSDEFRLCVEALGEAVAAGVSTGVKDLSESLRALGDAVSAVSTSLEGLKSRIQRTPVPRSFTPTRSSIAGPATPLALAPVPPSDLPPVDIPPQQWRQFQS